MILFCTSSYSNNEIVGSIINTLHTIKHDNLF
jgi:hypothetical protein